MTDSKFTNLLLAILPVTLLSIMSAPLSAALIFVDEASDAVVVDNNCSLREAVIAANANTTVDECTAGNSSGSDAIFVLTGQRISLNGPLVITDSVSITGPGIDNLVLLPAGTGYPAFRVDVANTGEDFSLTALRIGGFSESAVEIVNADVVTLDRVRLASNSVSTGGAGVNAVSVGQLGPTQSLTELIVRNSEFIQNDGPAIYSWSNSDLTVENSLFQGNRSDGAGAAISTGSTDQILTITDSSFVDNRSNPGASPQASGGAVSSSFNTLLVSRSYFESNYAPRGGAIRVGRSSAGRAVATVINSTFTDNDSDGNHSVVDVRGELDLSINYSTFSDNQIARLLRVSQANVRLIGNVFDQPGNNDCVIESVGSGSITSLGFNIETDSSTCTSHPDDAPSTPIQFLPAGDYGGSTFTMPPHPASPAVDAGPLAPCNDATNNFTIGEDQRGEPRPRDGDASGGLGRCDSGAFEWPNANLLAISFGGGGLGQVLVLGEFPLTCDGPNACQLPLPEDEIYTLAAIPAPGNQFTGWGGACSGHGSCQVTLDFVRFVSASFELKPDAIFSDRFEN